MGSGAPVKISAIFCFKGSVQDKQAIATQPSHSTTSVYHLTTRTTRKIKTSNLYGSQLIMKQEVTHSMAFCLAVPLPRSIGANWVHTLAVVTHSQWAIPTTRLMGIWRTWLKTGRWIVLSFLSYFNKLVEEMFFTSYLQIRVIHKARDAFGPPYHVTQK